MELVVVKTGDVFLSNSAIKNFLSQVHVLRRMYNSVDVIHEKLILCALICQSRAKLKDNFNVWRCQYSMSRRCRDIL
jgi:hypothetical protein